jgi:hypothetical protein
MDELNIFFLLLVSSPVLIVICAAFVVPFLNGVGLSNDYENDYICHNEFTYIEQPVFHNMFSQHGMSDSLYLIQDSGNGAIKIGRSMTPHRRLKQLQTGNSSKLYFVAVFPGDGWREKLLHKQLAYFRLEGEWFSQEVLNYLPYDMIHSINEF